MTFYELLAIWLVVAVLAGIGIGRLIKGAQRW
jgi:hypothetical protein